MPYRWATVNVVAKGVQCFSSFGHDGPGLVMSRSVMSPDLYLGLAHTANVSLPRISMATCNAQDSDSSSESGSESSVASLADSWEQQAAQSVNSYTVSLRRELDVLTSEANRQHSFVNRRQAFVSDYDWQNADAPSVINTEEALDL